MSKHIPNSPLLFPFGILHWCPCAAPCQAPAPGPAVPPAAQIREPIWVKTNPAEIHKSAPLSASPEQWEQRHLAWSRRNLWAKAELCLVTWVRGYTVGISSSRTAKWSSKEKKSAVPIAFNPSAEELTEPSFKPGLLDWSRFQVYTSETWKSWDKLVQA